jgi:hypothetical protein
MAAKDKVSCIKVKPGPLVAVMAFFPTYAAPKTIPIEAISSSACIKTPP